MMSKRVTIKDVAEDAHVSLATASFALNNVKGRVSEEVRLRVLKSAEKLHYTSNTSARSLRTNDTRTVMFVYSREYLMERNASYMTFLSGCVEYADRTGKGILLELIDTEAPLEEQVEKFKRIWASQRVNGIIFQCYFEDERDDVLYRILYQSGINLVNISRIGNSTGYPCVYLEEFQFARDQVRFAVDKGYKKLYYLCKKHRKPGIREEGFLDEVNGRGIHGEIIHYPTIYRTEDELWNLVKPLIADSQERTAILCWNDVDAISLMNALKKNGISIPEQVGVMGFDNIPLSEYVVPKLTTVSQPFEEMSRHALEILERADKRSPDAEPVIEHIKVFGEIIDRESM